MDDTQVATKSCKNGPSNYILEDPKYAHSLFNNKGEVEYFL